LFQHVTGQAMRADFERQARHAQRAEAAEVTLDALPPRAPFIPALSVKTLDESRKSGQAGSMRGAIRAASYRATFSGEADPRNTKPA
jgi:hypothetical protein